jgi:hypothetical protein
LAGIAPEQPIVLAGAGIENGQSMSGSPALATSLLLLHLPGLLPAPAL